MGEEIIKENRLYVQNTIQGIEFTHKKKVVKITIGKPVLSDDTFADLFEKLMSQMLRPYDFMKIRGLRLEWSEHKERGE